MLTNMSMRHVHMARGCKNLKKINKNEERGKILEDTVSVT